MHAQGRLARAGRTEQQKAGAEVKAAAQHGVEFGDSRLKLTDFGGTDVLTRDQAREDRQAAPGNGEVVITAAIFAAAKLGDPQAPAFGAGLRRHRFQVEDALGDALQLTVFLVGRGLVVEEQGRAFAALEKALQGQDFAAVAQGVL